MKPKWNVEGCTLFKIDVNHKWTYYIILAIASNKWSAIIIIDFIPDETKL